MRRLWGAGVVVAVSCALCGAACKREAPGGPHPGPDARGAVREAAAASDVAPVVANSADAAEAVTASVAEAAAPDGGADAAPDAPEEPAAPAAAPLAPHGDPTDSLSHARPLTDPALGAHRPRFSPDGRRIVFFAGPAGHADVYVVGVDGTGQAKLTDDPADDRDPTWTRSGDGIVWSTNRGGNYDLWTMHADGSGAARLTDLDGDELEPAVSPVGYVFYAVFSDDCTRGGAAAKQVDAYDKVAFVRRTAGRNEVWFRSLTGSHTGRLSPAGLSCRAPSWSGDGLSLSWTCDGHGGPTVFTAEAQWEQDFVEALHALHVVPGTTPSCDYDDLERWGSTACMGGLPRHYARYAPAARSRPADKLEESAYSANRTLLLAGGGGEPGGLRFRPRGEGAWAPLPGAPDGARRPVWSPDGAVVAFEDSAGIGLADADFYLQDVRDLGDYPELYGAGRSALLHRNRFVARPGEEQEFFRVYEELRYARRAPFVSADAALQVFHDEFALLLRHGEEQAQSELFRLTGALYQHYLAALTAGDDPVARYYAVYFAVPYVFLAAAADITSPDGFEEPGDPLPAPALDQLRALVAGETDKLPDWVRDEVRRHVDAILAHATIGEIKPPDRDQPVPLDYTQFQVRGHYASSALAGWFVAVQWLGLVPLPLDASAFDLVTLLDSSSSPASARPDAGLPDVVLHHPSPPETLGDLWDHIDALIGAFLGRPVDIAVPHLRQVAREHPEWVAPFRRQQVLDALVALRGPTPFRGITGAVTREPPPPQFTFLPRRYGLDAEYFTKLSSPAIEGRVRPQALDVFAALGSDRAQELALAADEGQKWHDAYRTALDALAADNAAQPAAGLGPGDIYHSWLAMLAGLARPAGIPEDSVLFFARTEAWQDRRLYSALAGFAQLKHDAVLYAVQDYGAECDSDLPVYLFVEQPDLPPPRGFVDPAPRFFRAMARLADRVYRDLAGGEAPTAEGWFIPGIDSSELCGRYLAEHLATLAEKELRGETLSADDEAWLRYTGAMMEAIFLREEALAPRVSLDEGRTAQGIALAADVFNDLDTGAALELAVGRVADLYVVVPDAIGERLTAGGIFSFYELWQPMADRLTDASWNARLQRGDVPPPPAWTSSFLEPRPAGAPAPPRTMPTLPE